MLGLLVCVSLLQIPLPMVHHHDQFVSSGELAVHVDHLHHSDQVEDEDLHWHLVLPCDFADDGEGAGGELPHDAVINAVASMGAGVGDPSSGQFSWLSKAIRPNELLAGQPLIGPLPTRRRVSNVSSAVYTCAVICQIRV